MLHSNPSSIWVSTRMSHQQKTGSGKLLQTFMTINLLGYSLVLDYINRLRRTAEIRKMIYFYPSTVQQHWSCGLMHVQEHIKANQRFSSLPSQKQEVAKADSLKFLPDRLQGTGMQWKAFLTLMSFAADKQNGYFLWQISQKKWKKPCVTVMWTAEMFKTIMIYQVHIKMQKWKWQLYLRETGHGRVHEAESFLQCWRWKPNDEVPQ